MEINNNKISLATEMIKEQKRKLYFYKIISFILGLTNIILLIIFNLIKG